MRLSQFLFLSYPCSTWSPPQENVVFVILHAAIPIDQNQQMSSYGKQRFILDLIIGQFLGHSNLCAPFSPYFLALRRTKEKAIEEENKEESSSFFASFLNAVAKNDNKYSTGFFYHFYGQLGQLKSKSLIHTVTHWK